MYEHRVTVFGGTGFLGQQVVEALLQAGCFVRAAARHPERLTLQHERLETVAVDVRNQQAVEGAVTGATAVINAVALFVEKGEVTFDAIHVQAAERIARCANSAGVQRLLHISGLGVDEHSSSKFVRARARGEQVVRAAFADAVMVRPSVMFGRNDAFLSSLAGMTMTPVIPLFGSGDSRLQPAYVLDVAEACARLITAEQLQGTLFELGGAKIYSYKQVVQAVLDFQGRKRPMMPVPFAVWKSMTAVMSLLPNPPLTADQVSLIASDNVVSGGPKTFADLGIEPQSLESAMPQCLTR